MRPALVLPNVLLFLSAVRALPFGLDALVYIEKRHVAVETVERRHPQGLIDSLSSIGAEISSAFSPQSTATLNSGSAATRSSSDEDEDDETTTRRTTSTRSSSESTSTSTRRSASTEESSTTTESSTSEATSPTSEESTTVSTSESSIIAPTPIETAQASSTPEPSSSNGGGGVPTAGIVVGVVLGVALLAMIIFILFKWGPLAKWRENRAYEKMMERSYRPALDDKQSMGFGDNSNAGLGLAPKGAATVNAGATAVPPNDGYRGVRPVRNPLAMSPPSPAVPQRTFSFADGRGVTVEQERIRRKPLPTIGTGGGGQGGSPLVGVRTPTAGADGTEPWLPGGTR